MRANSARWGRPLRCGPFIGELYDGSLRWLRADGCECIRMLGLVVRDRAWRTLAPSARRVRRISRGWTIEGRTAVGSAWLGWRLAVASRGAGIDVRATMTAEGDIFTNRAGMVVLLPAITFAGARFVASHTNGAATGGRLTRAIAAHQPMVDLAGVRISASSGPTLALTFQGETFEMEDQRNWLDPSFKLYSRSLSRHIPYRIRDGAHVEQRVVIDVVREAKWSPRRHQAIRRGPMPALGIATVAGHVPAEPGVVDAMRELSPAFVLHRTDSRARGLAAARRFASSLDADLRVEAFGDSVLLADAIRRTAPASVAPYFTGTHVTQVLAERSIPITGGTFADFVMVNRNGIASAATRAAFALCPTVHARDDRSLIESLDSMPGLFAQARRIAGRRPLDVGSCALLRRLLPRTGRPATRGPTGDEQDYDVDPRQYEPIAAAWLACTIAAAAVSGVSSVCTFEAVGDRGLVRGSGDHQTSAFTVVRSRPTSY